jgi:serine protein kinase
MQEQDGNKHFNISERLEDLRREHEALRWEGTFRDYFELVAQNPRIAQLSHARINDMVHAAGIERLNEGTQHEILSYNFFAHELFGIEEPIAKIVEYFKSAAQRLEVRKRILLLMGPVGGGKSTIVNMLKRGLEDWTKIDAGAVYAIKDCPMHEEPLHLIPHQLRAEVEKHYGIYIEGDLCPQCRYALDKTYGGRHEDVKVHRVAFSEKERVGIGTFSPSDPKSQDITELTGSIDLSTIGEVGVESGRREVSLQPADAFTGTEHQDRPLRYDLRGRSDPFALERKRVHRFRRQSQIRSVAGSHHSRESALQPARVAGGKDLRQAPAPV